jgi:basic amino acid/polyamine antiporter, APA family
VAFGNGYGSANAWSYWITAWAGNAAIAVGWVLYVEHFINTGHNKLFSVLLVLVGLWIPAAINLPGVKNMGSVQMDRGRGRPDGRRHRPRLRRAGGDHGSAPR